MSDSTNIYNGGGGTTSRGNGLLGQATSKSDQDCGHIQ